jgi:hypothetical protein
VLWMMLELLKLNVHLSLTGPIKEKTTCVIYVDQTYSIYLPFSSKLVYMHHHIFLPHKHMYHQWIT